MLSFSQENKTHQIWNELLEKNVYKGNVNYKGFVSEKDKLQKYLDALSKEAPKRNWSKDEKLAYWINAYNAFTIKLIIDNYPTKSIKDLGGAIYKVNTPWDIKFIEIEGKKYDLNNIEHNILRKEFDEPRIHFAINCASVSCPNLRNEAYVANKLEKQLEEQTYSFINDSSKNKITSEKAELSKIFSWFKGDFTKNGSLEDFINKYAKVKITSQKISYLDYSWNLNEFNLSAKQVK